VGRGGSAGPRAGLCEGNDIRKGMERAGPAYEEIRIQPKSRFQIEMCFYFANWFSKLKTFLNSNQI
jgi:hypothetical protein